MTQERSGSPVIRILHLEDSPVDHQLVQRSLLRAGVAAALTRVDSLAVFAELLQSTEFDVVLADYSLPGFTALDAWATIQALPEHQRPSVPFILVSGAIGESAAVAAIQLGMSDYVPKSDLGKLAHVILRAMDVQEVRRSRERAHAELAVSERRLAEFALHLQSTIEQERASIAREIHDDIGGSLAAIQFDLAWIARHSSDPATQQHVGNATDMLRHAVGASQRIMMNLRPAVLDQGLSAALEWLCRGFEQRSGIPTHFMVLEGREPHQASPTGHDFGLSKAAQLTAYRTAQEALTNISKHADCTLVKVELNDAGGTLTLEISDDGCGIDAAKLAKPQSYGLKGLRERAKTVGGWLDVSTGANGGTSVILSIPLIQLVGGEGSAAAQPTEEENSA